MHFNMSEFIGNKLMANDGEVGVVSDMLFDDQSWFVRYFVITCGNWLDKKEILLIPSSLNLPRDESAQLSSDLTRDQIKKSPLIQSNLPVSRQFETELHSYYNWGPYWTYPISTAYGFTMYNKDMQQRANESGLEKNSVKQDFDPSLRSLKAMEHRRLRSPDGELGRIEDMLIEASEARVSHLVVDTKNWWPSKNVLILTESITDISSMSDTVDTSVGKKKIQSAPSYESFEAGNEAYLQSLDEYYLKGRREKTSIDHNLGWKNEAGHTSSTQTHS